MERLDGLDERALTPSTPRAEHPTAVVTGTPASPAAVGLGEARTQPGVT
jgi:hypothetical protein